MPYLGTKTSTFRSWRNLKNDQRRIWTLHLWICGPVFYPFGHGTWYYYTQMDFIQICMKYTVICMNMYEIYSKSDICIKYSQNFVIRNVEPSVKSNVKLRSDAEPFIHPLVQTVGQNMILSLLVGVTAQSNRQHHSCNLRICPGLTDREIGPVSVVNYLSCTRFNLLCYCNLNLSWEIVIEIWYDGSTYQRSFFEQGSSYVDSWMN